MYNNIVFFLRKCCILNGFWRLIWIQSIRDVDYPKKMITCTFMNNRPSTCLNTCSGGFSDRSITCKSFWSKNIKKTGKVKIGEFWSAMNYLALSFQWLQNASLWIHIYIFTSTSCPYRFAHSPRAGCAWHRRMLSCSSAKRRRTARAVRESAEKLRSPNRFEDIFNFQ